MRWLRLAAAVLRGRTKGTSSRLAQGGIASAARAHRRCIMKTGLKWSTRWILGGALALAVVALLALVLVPRLRGPEQRPAPADWPTQGWRSRTPEEQGFDSAKLAEGLLAIRDNNINIHSLMIIRHGSVILDAYFYP